MPAARTVTDSGAAAAASASASVSGIPVPTTNRPGWNLAFEDDFGQPSFAADEGWWAYSGATGGANSISSWSPSHDVISNDMLQIDSTKDSSALNSNWITGGLRMRQSQTYGKYLVRFKIDAGAGVSLDALLWPADNTWPPEIDFAEDNGDAGHTLDTASLHYTGNHYIIKGLSVNMTQWHTLGVEWTPGKLVYTLDGQPWSTVTSTHVPSTPMTLALQTAVYGCGDSWRICPTATTPSTVHLDVDWVAVFTPAAS